MKVSKRITVSIISMLFIIGFVQADNSSIKMENTTHTMSSLHVLVDYHINSVKGMNNYCWCDDELSSYSKMDDQ